MIERGIVISHPKSGRTWLRYALWLVGASVRFSHPGEETRPVGHAFYGIEPKVFNFHRRVLLRRCPIDTAVSYFFWVHGGSTPTMAPRDIDEFVLHPHWGAPKVKTFNDAWTGYLRHEALIMDYEAIHDDPRVQFASLFDHLGIEADVGQVVELSSFEEMAKVDDPQVSSWLGERKMRRGVVGGYKDHLKQKTIKELKKCLS